MNFRFWQHAGIFTMIILTPFIAWTDINQTQEMTTIIRKIVEKNFDDQGTDLEKIHREISQHLPLDPVKTQDYFEWLKKRENEVKKRFPLTDQQLRKDLALKAEKEHRLHKIGDTVTINYLLAKKLYSISGVYYKKADRFIYIGSSKILRKNIPNEFSPENFYTTGQHLFLEYAVGLCADELQYNLPRYLNKLQPHLPGLGKYCGEPGEAWQYGQC